MKILKMFSSSVIYTNIDCYIFYIYIINMFEQGDIYIDTKDDASVVKLIYASDNEGHARRCNGSPLIYNCMRLCEMISSNVIPNHRDYETILYSECYRNCENDSL